MKAEAARRAPSIASRSPNVMMKLGELVDRYHALAAKHGAPVALAAFELPQEETERLFSGYEEDYHIGRFFRFDEIDGARYSINGFPATHVSINAEIESIL